MLELARLGDVSQVAILIESTAPRRGVAQNGERCILRRKCRCIIDKKIRSGAMDAAGIPIPDKATIDALVHAFAVESALLNSIAVRLGGACAACHVFDFFDQRRLSKDRMALFPGVFPYRLMARVPG